MGWIILGVVLVCVALEVLIGLKRGIILSGVRLGFTVIGTVIAALCAKAITSKIIFVIAKSQDVNEKTLAAAGKALLDKLNTEVSLGSALGPHAAGLAMSAAVPFIFVVLFLLFKLITLFLYLILKAVLKKPLRADEPKPVWSKASGAVLGGLVGLLSCAIVFAPARGIVTRINESDSINDLCAILEQKANVDKSVTDTIRTVTESLGDAPSDYLFRYTGTEALSAAIVSGLSTITPSDIGSMGTSTKYDLQSGLAELLKLITPARKTIDVIASKDYFKKENLETISNMIDAILETKLLADSDKVALVKSLQPILDNAIKSATGQKNSDSSILGDFTDINGLKDSINKTLDVVSNLADIVYSAKKSPTDPGTPADPDDPLGLKNLDVEAILDQPEKIDKLIDSVFTIESGPEMISSLINNEISSSVGNEFADLIKPETLKEVGAETVREAVDSILPLTDMIKSGNYTADDVEKIDEKVDELAKLKIISTEDQKALKDYFKPNK